MKNKFAKNNLTKHIECIVASQLIIATGFLSTGVSAQENLEVEEVTVLGSRVEGRSAQDSAVPVDIISGNALSESGFTELGQALQTTAPSFNFSRTQISNGSDLYRPATLRGLQPDQTLVMINGKRRHNQALLAEGGTVGAGSAGTDMNAIPLTALQSVEVLRDGAAAQYGSDAIAGVINLRLKETTNETSGNIQYGETSDGDGGKVNFGFNTGFDLGTNGGFINFSAEYRDADRTNRAEPDTSGSSTIAPGEFSNTARFHQGDADTEFTSIFVNSMMPVGNGEFYVFGGISDRSALGSGFLRSFNSASQNVPQVHPDGFTPGILNEAKDRSISLGYRSELKDDWKYDISLTNGKNDYDFYSKNTINASIAAEYLALNPDATDTEIAANAGPTEGYSGGVEFEQTTFNADLTGELTAGSQPLYLALGFEFREEEFGITPGQIESYSCGFSDSGAVPLLSVIDGETTAECNFQAFAGFRTPTKADRSSYAAYVDVETELSEAWLIGAALRYEDYDGIGNKTTGKVSSRYDFSDAVAFRGAIATGFRAPSLQQTAFTSTAIVSGSDGSLSSTFTASAGSAFPVALGVDGLDIETSQSISMGFVINPSEDVSITIDAYSVDIKDRLALSGNLTADDVAFNAGAVAALNATGAVQARFFSNAVDTNTKGIDLIFTYGTELGDGDFDITFAANFNESEVDEIHSPDGIADGIVFDSGNESFLTGGQPQERGTLSFDYSKNAIFASLRLNYFGSTEVDQFAGNHIVLPGFLSPTGSFRETSIVESATLVDVLFTYDISSSFSVSVGGNNIFDERPEELGADEVLDFISRRAFKYPLRATPYGVNGATYYLRTDFKF